MLALGVVISEYF